MNLRNSLKEHLPSPGFRVFRRLLDAIYIAAEPFDFADRILNNRADYPPIWLRRRNGSVRQMEMSSAEFSSCSLAAVAPPVARGRAESQRFVTRGGEASPVEIFEQPNWGLKSFGKARITIMGIERA